MPRPNILLILTDQQSATAMSCAGNPWLRTPNLDRLAERGVRFTNAYTTCPVCVPARTSLFHGAYPHEVMLPGTDTDMGARPGDPKRGVKPEAKDRLLLRRLSSAGYRCVYSGKWHVEQWGPTESLPDDALERFSTESLNGIHDQQTADNGSAFLRQKHDRPFFLVASFDNPHNIHEWAVENSLPQGNLPPPPPPADLPPLPPNFRPSASEPAKLSPIRRHFIKDNERAPEDWRRYRWAYNRLVEKVDAQIGCILDALESGPHASDTLVIFTSDHGDSQGAHGLPFKNVLYDEACKVPLIVADPRQADAPQSAVSDTPVSSCLDIYATILELAKIEPDAPGIHRGHNLFEIASDSHPPADRPIISVARNPYAATEARMVRSSRFKYIVYSSGLRSEQLFDLLEDPGEQVNLADCRPFRNILAEHRESLRHWATATGDRFNPAHYVHPNTTFILPNDDYPDTNP